MCDFDFSCNFVHADLYFLSENKVGINIMDRVPPFSFKVFVKWADVYVFNNLTHQFKNI